MRRRVLPVLAVLVGALTGIVATDALAGARTAANRNVVLVHNRFHPGHLVLHRGDTVTWLWRDGSVQHNVVSMSFRGLVNPKSRGSLTVRFNRGGSYFYYCTIHPGMTGTIVVH
jgi:plastocyanin